MKAYIDKETNSLAFYTNFIPIDTTNLIELSESQYKELEEKQSNNYIPIFNYDSNNNVIISYTKDLSAEYHKELEEIKQWFNDNDWKVNKIVIGEWSNNDSRWLEYLKERGIKRARQDELNALLNK